MSSPAEIDAAVANDWIAVGVAGAATVDSVLFGRALQVRRDDAGLHARADGCAVRVAEHCGLLWACLGAQPRPLFALPEWREPGRRFLGLGAVALDCGALRVVENFLDMAHFPFVHPDVLGQEPFTEVPEYRVEHDAASDELWARGCRFHQPRAAAASAAAVEAHYVYRVVNPYTPLLYKASADAPGRQDIIFLATQPVSQETCLAHFAVSVFDERSADTEIADFQNAILAQDRPILENHVFKRLPLDGRLEVSVRADLMSARYRRWLRDKGLRHGVLLG